MLEVPLDLYITLCLLSILSHRLPMLLVIVTISLGALSVAVGLDSSLAFELLRDKEKDKI